MSRRSRQGRGALMAWRRSQLRAEFEQDRPTHTAEIRAAREGQPCIDLLHHEPLIRVDTEALLTAIRFAFESGDAGGLLRQAIDEMPVVESSWDPKAFSQSLFLPELVRHAFSLTLQGPKGKSPKDKSAALALVAPEGPESPQKRAGTGPISEAFMVRLLSQPPQDRRHVQTRQEVLRELTEHPELTISLKAVYLELKELRTLLDESPMDVDETIRRKLELLAAFRRLVSAADSGFENAQSALKRLHVFGRDARNKDAHERLLQVLDLDDHLATLDVRLQVGADGKIRSFALVKAQENIGNPILRPAWRRFLSRLIALLRGYKFHENEVLLKVVDEVFDSFEEEIVAAVAAIADLEAILAAMAFRERAKSEGLDVCLPHLKEAGASEKGKDARRAQMKGLFNPLLWLQGVSPKSCSIETEERDLVTVVTGPNSGGKTRFIQAIALAQLLGEVGFFVPAREASLTHAPALFVSLIDHAPADQKEGRLGTELMRVRNMFEQLCPASLVILDELCSGTNPSEGVAIFEMVLKLLPQIRPQVFVTTHFLDAARRLSEAQDTANLRFLQVELDDAQEPTYDFVPGVARTSLARQIASRLGVTEGELQSLLGERLEVASEMAAQ